MGRPCFLRPSFGHCLFTEHSVFPEALVLPKLPKALKRRCQAVSGTDVHDTKIQRHLAVPQSAEVRTFQKLCAQEHRLIIHNTFISH